MRLLGPGHHLSPGRGGGGGGGGVRMWNICVATPKH